MTLKPTPDRCSHTTRISLPGAHEPVEARCWLPADADDHLCAFHALMASLLRDVEAAAASRKAAADTAGLIYLCPAPTSRWFRCKRPLPCTSHGIDTPEQGLILHGDMLLQIPAKAERRRQAAKSGA
jgi:hypothetical protein